jgi:ankyrin repeat protein
MVTLKWKNGDIKMENMNLINLRLCLLISLVMGSGTYLLSMDEPPAKRSHVDELIEASEDQEDLDGNREQLETALSQAIQAENIEETKRLIKEEGATLNLIADKVEGMEIPLFEAINTGNVAMIKLLLDHGASANIADSEINAHLTPVRYILNSIFNEETIKEIVKLLVGNGADINALSPQSSTALSDTISFSPDGYLSIMRFLIEHGASANIARGGETPLVELYNAREEFSEEKQVAIAKELALGGAHFNFKNSYELAIVAKAFHGHPLALGIIFYQALPRELENTIKEHIAAASSAEKEEALTLATARGNKNVVLNLLGEEVSQEKILALLRRVNAILDHHPLKRRKREQYESLAQQLIRRLSLVEQILHRPELTEAITLADGVKQLPLELGIRINATAALWIAVKSGRVDDVLQALEAGANANALDESGTPILAFAAFHHDIEKSNQMVACLLEFKAVPTVGLLYLLCCADSAQERKSIIAMIYTVAQEKIRLTPTVKSMCERILGN